MIITISNNRISVRTDQMTVTVHNASADSELVNQFMKTIGEAFGEAVEKQGNDIRIQGDGIEISVSGGAKKSKLIDAALKAAFESLNIIVSKENGKNAEANFFGTKELGRTYAEPSVKDAYEDSSATDYLTGILREDKADTDRNASQAFTDAAPDKEKLTGVAETDGAKETGNDAAVDNEAYAENRFTVPEENGESDDNEHDDNEPDNNDAQDEVAKEKKKDTFRLGETDKKPELDISAAGVDPFSGLIENIAQSMEDPDEDDSDEENDGLSGKELLENMYKELSSASREDIGENAEKEPAGNEKDEAMNTARLIDRAKTQVFNQMIDNASPVCVVRLAGVNSEDLKKVVAEVNDCVKQFGENSISIVFNDMNAVNPDGNLTGYAVDINGIGIESVLSSEHAEKLTTNDGYYEILLKKENVDAYIADVTERYQNNASNF